MSVFRYKGSKAWTMDFIFHVQRIRESTGASSKTFAGKIQDKRYGAAGDKFCAKAYDIHPSKPIGSINEEWQAARLRAAVILKGETAETDSKEKIAPLACRFHELRLTAVPRMLNAGIPIAKVAKIAGWSSSTMVLMAKRYGHFSLDDLRGAVESINGSGIETGSLVISRVSENTSEAIRPNLLILWWTR